MEANADSTAQKSTDGASAEIRQNREFSAKQQLIRVFVCVGPSLIPYCLPMDLALSWRIASSFAVVSLLVSLLWMPWIFTFVKSEWGRRGKVIVPLAFLLCLHYVGPVLGAGAYVFLQKPKPKELQRVWPRGDLALLPATRDITYILRNFPPGANPDVVAHLDGIDVSSFLRLNANRLRFLVADCLRTNFPEEMAGKHVLEVCIPSEDCANRLRFSSGWRENFECAKEQIFERTRGEWSITDGRLHGGNDGAHSDPPAMVKFKGKMASPMSLAIVLAVTFNDSLGTGGLNISLPPYAVEIGDGGPTIFAIKKRGNRSPASQRSPEPDLHSLRLPPGDLGRRCATDISVLPGVENVIRVELQPSREGRVIDIRVFVNDEPTIWWQDCDPQPPGALTALSLIAWPGADFFVDCMVITCPFWEAAKDSPLDSHAVARPTDLEAR